MKLPSGQWRELSGHWGKGGKYGTELIVYSLQSEAFESQPARRVQCGTHCIAVLPQLSTRGPAWPAEAEGPASRRRDEAYA